MKLTVLGSGSPEAYARRASSGYLLEVGEDRILFDCGGGVVDNLIRSGRLPKDRKDIRPRWRAQLRSARPHRAAAKSASLGCPRRNAPAALASTRGDRDRLGLHL